MSKKEKKQRISESIDLSNGRYKDEEVDSLYDLVTNSNSYIGKSKTKRERTVGWSSDGKYVRDEETTYTIREDDGRIRIDEDYRYEDDDGQSGESSLAHTTARAILGLLGLFDD